MGKSKSKTPRRSNRAIRRGEAVDLMPLIDSVQDSLDRLQFLYEEGGDVCSALLDLQCVIGDLEDGIERNDEAQDASR